MPKMKLCRRTTLAAFQRMMLLAWVPVVVVSLPTTSSPSVSPAPSAPPSFQSPTPTVSSPPSVTPSISVHPTVTPSANPSYFCYDNTTTMFQDIGRKSLAFWSTYVLCPGTYEVGSVVSGKCCDADAFLSVRTKTIIQCGTDGSSANGCIIRRGRHQLVMGPGGHFAHRVDDAVVKGITFENAERSNVLTAVEGSILFEDCIFRNNRQAEAPVLSIFQGWLEKYAGTVDNLLVSTFKNCIFENNVYLASSAITAQEGLVTALPSNKPSNTDPTNHMVFERCIFRNNTYPNGWAIKATNSIIEIRESCFYDNYFGGQYGMIQVNGEKSRIISIQNYVGSSASGTTMTTTPPPKCEFIAKSTKTVPDGPGDIECVAASDTQQCPVDGYRKNLSLHTDNSPAYAPSVSILQAALFLVLFLVGFY